MTTQSTPSGLRLRSDLRAGQWICDASVDVIPDERIMLNCHQSAGGKYIKGTIEGKNSPSWSIQTEDVSVMGSGLADFAMRYLNMYYLIGGDMPDWNL